MGSSRFRSSCSPATTIVGDDPAKVTFEREGIYTDQKTGKPVAAVTRYTYRDGEDRYVVSFTRTHDLSVNRMIATIKGVKHIAARLAGFDGAYLRFIGALEISRYRGHELIEAHKQDAIWELMYFGHARTVQRVTNKAAIGVVRS